MNNEAAHRPYYLSVIFWGETHRNYFVRFLLSSLLAPGNLSELAGERGHKFLVATTAEDWAALQSEPLFQAMAAICEPVLIEFPVPAPDEPKMRVQSNAHRQISERFFADRAYGLYLTPDMILARGTMTKLRQLAVEGCKVVLCVAIRYEQDQLDQALSAEGLRRPDGAIDAPARDLMRVGLANLHSETLCYDFQSTCLAQSPISVFWRVPDGSGIIIYSFSWCPLLVDYSSLACHSTETFDEWTLDGDYIHRNFPSASDVHVVRDSDDICMVSLTREADLSFDLSPRPGQTGPFATANKLNLINLLWQSHVIDELKREIFTTPVFLHHGSLSSEWTSLERKASWLIQVAAGRGYGNCRHLFLAYIKAYRIVSGVVRSVSGNIWWHYRYRHFVVHRLLWKVGLRRQKPEWTEPQWLARRAPGLLHPVSTVEWLVRTLRSEGKGDDR